MTRLLRGALAASIVALCGSLAFAGPLRPNEKGELYSPPWSMPFATLVNSCEALSDRQCSMLRQLALMPHAYWAGIEPSPRVDVEYLHRIMTDSRDKGQIPTIVIYSLPYRSCGGGVPLGKRMTNADYRSWVSSVADAIKYYKDQPVNIIIEPGGFSHLVIETDAACYSKAKSELLEERIELIRKTLWEFVTEDEKGERANPNTRIFVDVGGPGTVPDAGAKITIVKALEAILRDAKFDGISVNVGGYASFDESVAWAEDLIGLFKGDIKKELTMAVDISRSGGTKKGGCNAPGAALDVEPQALSHEDPMIELVTIIQDPSMSDGDSAGCNSDVPAGEFDLRHLRDYLENSSSKHALLAPATRPTKETASTRYVAAAMSSLKWLTDRFAPAEIGVADIVTKDKYKRIFPEHVDFYSYEQFVRGAAAISGFCTTGDTPTRIRECAAFLANAAHETGSGKHITEESKPGCSVSYCDYTQTGACAPAKGKAYFGRGLLQPSWNYNYCAASKYIFHDDGSTLVQKPEILEQDAAISTQASLWYWMTQASASTMPSHECITKGAGFGCTVRSINGALECNGKRSDLVKEREAHYLRILDILGDGKVQPVGRNDC